MAEPIDESQVLEYLDDEENGLSVALVERFIQRITDDTAGGMIIQYMLYQLLADTENKNWNGSGGTFADAIVTLLMRGPLRKHLDEKWMAEGGDGHYLVKCIVKQMNL